MHNREWYRWVHVNTLLLKRWNFEVIWWHDKHCFVCRFVVRFRYTRDSWLIYKRLGYFYMLRMLTFMLNLKPVFTKSDASQRKQKKSWIGTSHYALLDYYHFRIYIWWGLVSCMYTESSSNRVDYNLKNDVLRVLHRKRIILDCYCDHLMEIQHPQRQWHTELKKQQSKGIVNKTAKHTNVSRSVNSARKFCPPMLIKWLSQPMPWFKLFCYNKFKIASDRHV